MGFSLSVKGHKRRWGRPPAAPRVPNPRTGTYLAINSCVKLLVEGAGRHVTGRLQAMGPGVMMR